MIGSVESSSVVDPTLVEIEAAGQLFGALADPARLRVLSVLADAGRCVCDIRSATPMTANLLSYHLRALSEAGLVVGVRRGRFVDYRMADHAAVLIWEALGAAGFTATVDQPQGCAGHCEVPT